MKVHIHRFIRRAALVLTFVPDMGALCLEFCCAVVQDACVGFINSVSDKFNAK